VIATPIEANDSDVRSHARYVRSFAIVRLSCRWYLDDLSQQIACFPVQGLNGPVPTVEISAKYVLQSTPADDLLDLVLPRGLLLVALSLLEVLVYSCSVRMLR
jgi:hypothetical protein